jgi:hypothetical protein
MTTPLRPNPITPLRPPPMVKRRPRPTEGAVDPPSNDVRKLDILVGLWVLAIIGVIWVAWPTTKPPVRQIRVGSQVCGVRFVQTGQFCSSWGTCSPVGYDEAVCPPSGPLLVVLVLKKAIEDRPP